MISLFSILQSDRKKFNNLLEKAELNRQHENYKDSQFYLSKALQIAESNNSIDISEYDEGYIYNAWLCENNKDFNGAVHNLEKAVRANDSFQCYCLELAIFKSNINDYEGAIKELNLFCKQRLLYRKVKFNCISDLFDNNDIDNLFAGNGTKKGLHLSIYNDYDSALLAIAFYLSGIFNSEIEDYKNASTDYSTSLAFIGLWDDNIFNKKIQSEYVEIYKFRALTGLGKTLYKLKNYRKAISTYNEIIEKFEQNKCAEIYYNRGLARIAINSTKGAVEDFILTLEIDPQNVSAKTSLEDAKRKTDE